MSRYTTLRVGGPADYLYKAVDREELAELVTFAQLRNLPYLLIGEGSNICVSDLGIRGLTIVNRSSQAKICTNTEVDAGFNFMRLSVQTMQMGLMGLEWAVGIPGTIGGALVSNAGAYGGNIADIVENIEIVESGIRKTVEPAWMEFSYRDSRLRRDQTRPAVLLGATLRMDQSGKPLVRLKARDIQRQRIMKQPWEPSAGSFFKNIHNKELAQSIPDLPDLMKERGVVTSAFLIDKCGCKGLRIGDAAISVRHANFVLNHANARAADIRMLVNTVRQRVMAEFGIELEEEVLYLGDWGNQN